ncbi:hypothetical protein H2199_006916 [Coniosporium tulheliwenetii]|uniref:Uncharacterized protein n=1 Tax=Coniosporium tulheliwenetii TaxID=3383036 RepID=A0ACC2YSW5_9PEZI|nr:hypothetical protein H2199_006916 [Cladosporium sp. JES 115]
MSYDTIVVGGGTAGCTIAAIVSEAPGHRVLLLEAGHEYTPSSQGLDADAIRDARRVPMRGHSIRFDHSHDWNLELTMPDGSTMDVPQARLLGGGSAINASIALRGPIHDFDLWEREGNPHWGWKQVLQAYKEIEDDTAGSTEIHGPFVNAARRNGFKYEHDLNAPDAEGVGPAPMTRVNTRRITAAMVYTDAVRHRKNLIIQPDTTINRVLFSGTKVRGVTTADGTVIHAPRVVVCGGAIMTPCILQRSGVGPKKLLDSLAIPVVADLPVGENLGDHVSFPLLAQPKPHAYRDGDDFSLQTIARFSSKARPGTVDLQLTCFSYLNAGNPDPRVEQPRRSLAGGAMEGVTHVAGIGAVLNKPLSTGNVSIRSRDPKDLPMVNPNYLAERIDVLAAREMVRAGFKLLVSPEMQAVLGPPLNLDQETLDSDEKLDAAIYKNVASAYHFAGTCKMASTARGGVVDESGRVWGLTGLIVGDASVIPTVPSANTMLPTAMTAHRIAISLRDNVDVGRRGSKVKL